LSMRGNRSYLLGVKLVTATIARISQDCARRFQGFADGTAPLRRYSS